MRICPAAQSAAGISLPCTRNTVNPVRELARSIELRVRGEEMRPAACLRAGTHRQAAGHSLTG